MSTVPPRSYLFVPGNRPERFAKALASGADALILDLEDSVPAAEKDAARDAVVHWLRSGAAGATPVWVRINALGTAAHEADLRAVALGRPVGVVLPSASWAPG